MNGARIGFGCLSISNSGLKYTPCSSSSTIRDIQVGDFSNALSSLGKKQMKLNAPADWSTVRNIPFKNSGFCSTLHLSRWRCQVTESARSIGQNQFDRFVQALQEAKNVLPDKSHCLGTELQLRAECSICKIFHKITSAIHLVFQLQL